MPFQTGHFDWNLVSTLVTNYNAANPPLYSPTLCTGANLLDTPIKQLLVVTMTMVCSERCPPRVQYLQHQRNPFKAVHVQVTSGFAGCPTYQFFGDLNYGWVVHDYT